MKDYLVNRAKDFKNDPIQYSACAVSIVLAIFHFLQLINLDYIYNPIVKLIFHALFPFGVFLFGRSGIYIQLFLYANIEQYFLPYNNFNGFFITLLFCKMYKKWLKFAVFFYITNASVTLALQGNKPIYVLIHFATCIFFYYIYYAVNNKNINIEDFSITEDEEKILKELAKGKQQKEIDFFNKNTVTKKIRQAKERNHCLTNEELLLKYIKYSNNL